LTKKERDLIFSAFREGRISSGESVRVFERRLKGISGRQDAVALNSGTSALHLSLIALGAGAGDEVIIPSYACSALLDAVNYVGAKPVLADCDYDTFNISFSDTKRKMTKKTKAVIISHMFGLPCEADKFAGLGVPVIEDCAQAPGATYKGKPAGSFGDLSVFSFYATKIIATGYGGAVAGDRGRLIKDIKDLSDPDKKEKYRIRYNYRMPEMAAILGISQLGSLKKYISRRKKIASIYMRALSGKGYELPEAVRGGDHIYYRFVIKADGQAGLLGRLKKAGIESIRPVYKPAHRYLNMDRRLFPNTEKVYGRAVSLPIYPALTDSEARFIVNTLNG
jgi:perosamine synthetase